FISDCTTSFGPLAAPILWLSRIFGNFSFKTFGEQTAKVIEIRKKHPELRRNDLLQNLIDAEYEDLAPTQTSSGEATSGIIMNSTVLFVGGFDTSATALSFITYALGKYPDVQEKVRQEVNEVLNEGVSLIYSECVCALVFYENIVALDYRVRPLYVQLRYRAGTSSMHYNFLCTLSMFSLRHLTDCTLGHRAVSYIRVLSLSAFSEENEGSIPKLAFQPFGMGPRNCLGLRLAYLDLAYTVARMAQNFRWELGESQKAKMPLGQYGMVATPGRGPWIVFHRL
ncbi:cytochrome P450, putative, partial [Ixodes scapularis]